MQLRDLEFYLLEGAKAMQGFCAAVVATGFGDYVKCRILRLGIFLVLRVCGSEGLHVWAGWWDLWVAIRLALLCRVAYCLCGGV